MDVELVPFEPAHAALVPSWAPTADEVRRWVSRDTVPVPAEVVLGWADEEDSLTFVARVDGEPVGFGQVWLEDGEDDAEVARLLVAPDHRGRGVGRALVLALAEVAQRYKPSVALRVVPDNEQALRAYAAAGFAHVTADEEREYNQGQPVGYVWMRLRPPGPDAVPPLTGLAAEVDAQAAQARRRYAAGDVAHAVHVTHRWRRRFGDAARDGDAGEALSFLEADPWCHRSGYAMAPVLRTLAHRELDEEQRRRARDHVVHRARNPRQGLLGPTALLAASVWDDGLHERLREVQRTADGWVGDRVRWLLAGVEARLPEFGPDAPGRRPRPY